jgi:hypothetical protein
MGRFGTDRSGYAAMRRHVAGWPERIWAVEGSNGAGRPLAQRLLADGEQWWTCPPSWSPVPGCSIPGTTVRPAPTMRTRSPWSRSDQRHVLGGWRSASRTEGLRVLSYDVELEALRMLADRREELTRQRVQTVNGVQRQLSELTPGRAKKDITALQAKGPTRTPTGRRRGTSQPSNPRSSRNCKRSSSTRRTSTTSCRSTTGGSNGSTPRRQVALAWSWATRSCFSRGWAG